MSATLVLCRPQSARSLEPSASHLDSLQGLSWLSRASCHPASPSWVLSSHASCLSHLAVWALCHPHLPRMNFSHVAPVWLVLTVSAHGRAFLAPSPRQLPPGPDEFHHACLKSFDFQFANLTLVLQNFGNPAKPGARCRFNEHIFSSFFPVSMKMLRGTGS